MRFFYEAWERLRDLLRQCMHLGIPKHEIAQIFYDGLGALTRRDREVVDFTRSRVKNNTELTNLGN